MSYQSTTTSGSAGQFSRRAGRPGIGVQRRQSPASPSPVTAFVWFTVFPGRDKIAANAGPLGVDGTEDRFADNAFESDAPGIFPIGAQHYQSKVIELFGKLDGHTVLKCFIRLAPVKRGTEEGAAGTASETRVGAIHKRLPFTIKDGLLWKIHYL
jgi:hypothetical protein